MKLDTDNTHNTISTISKNLKELLICCHNNYINQQWDKGKMGD